jgi:hypothetical protein
MGIDPLPDSRSGYRPDALGKEAVCGLAVHDTPHGRKGTEQDAAIARRGQPPVEHRHHTAVVTRANEPTGTLGEDQRRRR